jgi:hypothetical protein
MRLFPSVGLRARRSERGPTSREKQKQAETSGDKRTQYVIVGFPQTQLWLLIAITRTGGGSPC